MRGSLSLVTGISIFLMAGCGYVGPVLPPSLHLPEAVTNLSATERGKVIYYQFTVPSSTTDGITIRQFAAIELKIGPEVHPFDLERWAAAAKQYDIEPPPALSKKDDPATLPPNNVNRSIPAADWVGQSVAMAVRTASKEGRFSAWSNVIHLTVVDPLTVPVLQAESDAKGVKLHWEIQRAGLQYRILRQGAKDPQPIEVGIADGAEYIDTSAQYDVPYRYIVIARQTSTGEHTSVAESEPSATIAITAVDTFPPSVPAGVTALGTPNSIEISWERSTESDLKGYYVYRSVDGSPFTRVGDLLATPTMSDKDIQAGKKYSYQISSVDERGNESARSTPVEITF